MAFAIDITGGRGLSNETHHELLLKKQVLAFLFPVNSHLTSCALLTRRNFSVLKVDVTCEVRSF